MEFEVKFYCSERYLVQKPSVYVGTNKVKEVRELLGVNVPIELFKGYVSSLHINTETTKVSESLAFESGVFGHSCAIEVDVTTPNGFVQFTEITTHIKRDSQTDAILEISFKYELNKLKVLEAWEAAGFPTEWDLSNID